MTLSATPSRRLRPRALRLGALALLGLAAPFTAGACSSSKSDVPAPSASASSAAAASSSAAPSVATPTPRLDAEGQPVYPLDAGPPDPQAQRFCAAIQALPEERKVACCAGAPTGNAPVASCVRTLSYALAQHAITIAPADLDACVAAMTKATLGCDWVTPFAAAIPPECTGILKGQLPEKERCRSSLECGSTLRCQGLSATDIGACGPPRPDRFQCGAAIDMLAAYTRQDGVDRDHPECQGYCVRSQCQPALAPGAECKSDPQCGKGRCVAGKCADGPLPALGAACPAGMCAPGAGCVQGTCVTPKAEGEACSSYAECRGQCVTGDAGTAGTCSRRCPSFALPVRNPPGKSRR